MDGVTMEADKEDVTEPLQQSSHSQPQPQSGETDFEQMQNGEPAYSPFEFDDYYNYRASGMDYDQYYGNPDYYQNISDSNSDEEGQQQGSGGGYSVDSSSESRRAFRQQFDAEGAFSRFRHNSNSEEEEGKAEDRKVVDPGPFQYNKRVFITALPCLLLMLIMTGETLLLMVTLGAMLIGLMTQIGGDVGKRCVVVFTLLFIPCHILVVGTVLPLLWLSVWNLLLLLVVNVFCVLTGGWAILQFQAFRMEEPAMCAMIERGLFSVYPCVCSALVTWVLSTVVPPPVTPFLFICLWFVCLQLYLMPAASSFKVKQAEEGQEEDHHQEEDLGGVLSQPTVLGLILTFALSGPLLHTVLTIAGYSTLAFWSLPSLAVLAMLACLGLFLSTLLNLRQLCDYWGLRHGLVVQSRWGSGAGVVVLCYPVLQQQGIVSHFLMSLPIAVAAFTSFGLALNLKKGKVLPLLVMVVLMVLLGLWLNHLPWTLTYSLLGRVPLQTFYGLVAANFVLCLITLYASWHNSKELFGCLLLLQSIGLTICELGLYQAGLYSTPAFQLSGILAAYTLHRLFLANKLTRLMAVLTSAVQLTKTTLGVIGYLVREGERSQVGDVSEISTADFLTMLLMVGVVVWLFVYETKEEVTLLQAGKHVGILMVSLGVSGQSFLLPVGDFLLQDDLTLADLVGLWYGVGGVLVLLYALQRRLTEGLTEPLVKVAAVMGGVGALVMVMQPQFLPTLYALTQWSEVLSVLLIAALLATGVDMSLPKILVTSTLLGIAPGIHATLMVYEDIATVMHFVLLSALCCHLLALLFLVVKTEQVTEAVERVIKTGAGLVLCLLVALLSVDLINFEHLHTVWDYPAWQGMLAVTGTVALALKALALRLGPHHLPLVKREDHSVPLVPLIANLFTVLAFLLAATQGPFDTLLHDLWVCAASLLLVCLQRDSLLLCSLCPSNRAAPTVLAAVATLVVSAVLQCSLWQLQDLGSAVSGLLELLTLAATLPVYAVLTGVLWRGQVWSEQAVVFSMPLNALLILLGSSYTAWLLCLVGFVCGLGMMIFRLPLLPKNFEPLQR